MITGQCRLNSLPNTIYPEIYLIIIPVSRALQFYDRPVPHLQFFGYKLDYCTVPGSTQLCPWGMTWRDCPSHFDCYVPCNSSVAFQWYEVFGSPYGGMAYCEMFPSEAAVDISPPPPAPPPSMPSSQPSSPLSQSMASSSGRRHLQQSNGTAFQLLAQVGKPTTFMPNYDNIYQARLRYDQLK